MQTWLLFYSMMMAKVMGGLLLAGTVLATGTVHQWVTPPIHLMVVGSGSMAPNLKLGDVVVVKPAPLYKAGEVITFQTFGLVNTLVTHRIKTVHQTGNKFMYQTQGDANNVADLQMVAFSQVVGKQVLRVPMLGLPVLWIQTPLGVICLVVVPTSVIIYEELKTLWPLFMNYLKALPDKKRWWGKL